MNPVFITGGTGYIGGPLIGALLERAIQAPPTGGVRILEVPDIRR